MSEAQKETYLFFYILCSLTRFQLNSLKLINSKPLSHCELLNLGHMTAKHNFFIIFRKTNHFGFLYQLVSSVLCNNFVRDIQCEELNLKIRILVNSHLNKQTQERKQKSSDTLTKNRERGQKIQGSRKVSGRNSQFIKNEDILISKRFFYIEFGKQKLIFARVLTMGKGLLITLEIEN